MDIVNLAVKVATGEIDKAQKSLQGLQRELEKSESLGFKFGSAIGGSVKLAAQAFAGVATAIAGMSLVFAAQIDDLNDLAEMYGYSATQIQAMKLAAEAAGTSLEEVMKAGSRARRELATGGEAFKNLGISIKNTNGEMKTSSELATEVAKKYRDGGTTVSQYADVQAVLGKDVDKTAAALVSQADALKMVNDLHDKGIGIVQGAITATDDFSTAKTKANVVMTAAGSILVAKVVPAFTLLISSLTDSYVNGGLVKKAFDGIVAMLPGMLQFGGFVAKIFVTAGNTVRAFGDTLGAAGAVLASLASGDFAGAWEISKAWKSNVDAIDADNQRAMKSIDTLVASMVTATANVDLSLQKGGDGRNAPGGVGSAGGKASSKNSTGSGVENGSYLDGRTGREMSANIARQNEVLALYQREADAYRDLIDPVRVLNREIEEIGNSTLTAAEKSKAITLVSDRFYGLKNTVEETTPAFDLMGRIGDSAFKGLEDSIVSLSTTGKFNFKSMIISVLGDISRLMTQVMIIQPLMDKFKQSMGAGGGVGGFLSSLFGAAAGSAGFGASGTGNLIGASTVGMSLAVGTNYVPYDGMKATLHEGEAVVPKKYNPAAGGKSGSGGNTYVTFGDVVVQGGTTNEETGAAVQKAQLKMMEQVARGVISKEKRNGGLLAA